MIDIYGFDTETTPLNHFYSPNLRLWVLSHASGKEHHFGVTTYEFLKFLKERETSCIIVAFNLPYDFSRVFEENGEELDLSQHFDRIRIQIEGARPYKCVLSSKYYRKKRVTITFVELANYTGIYKLKELSESFGVQPKFDDFEDNWIFTFEEKWLDPVNSMMLYCLNDADIVGRIYSDNFYLRDKRGNIRPSISSIGFYELKQMSGWKPFSRPDFIVKDFERPSFYGGIVWVRLDTRKKQVRGKKKDVNSHYSNAMRHMKVPVKLIEKFGSVEDYNTFAIINRLITLYRSNDRLSIIKCKVNIKRACIPYRSKDKSIEYPEGEYSGTWIDEELIPRVLDGEVEILQIFGYVVYECIKGMFSSFVDKHYKIKIESKGAKAQASKLRLNSSFGKFAQKMRYRKSIDPREIKWIKHYKIDSIDGMLIRVTNGEYYIEQILDKEAYGSCTVISGIVTAKSRCKLFEEMIRPYNPYYCDTDSGIIPFELEFDPLLLDEKRLGAWKDETHNQQHGDIYTIYGKKDYEVRYINDEGKPCMIRKHKGVPDKFKQIAKNKFRGDKVIKLREGKRRNLAPYIMVIMEKERKKWV